RKLGNANRSQILAAAADADGATFDRLLAAAATETDPELRSDLLRALSQVSDEKRLRAVLALSFDKRLEPPEARQLVLAGRMQPQFRVVDAYFREHLPELLARFPDNGIGGAVGLSVTFLRGCDPAHRDEAAAFVKQHFSKYPGSPRIIARGL